MKLSAGKICITRAEMKEIKRMDHKQMEQKLTEVMESGRAAGAEAAKEELYTAMAKYNRLWRAAVEASMEELKGIGGKRKELFLEYLRVNLKKAGICIR